MPKSDQRSTTFPVLTAVLAALVLAFGIWSYSSRKSRPPLAPLPDVSKIKIDPDYSAKNSAICEGLCAARSDKASIGELE